nr:glycoside hydrolase family 55 protein [Duncaniella sp.]
MLKKLFSAALIAAVGMSVQAALPFTVKDGKVDYTVDSLGNRMLDYSTCGYRSSEAPIPDVAVAVYVAYKPGDNSERIQRAIDYVSSLPISSNGERGAVLLGPGEFEISSSLRISASGVVLRGSGVNSTVIKKTGVSRGALIYVEGVYDPVIKDTIEIADSYVPVNSTTINFGGKNNLRAGDRVFILRPSTAEWIKEMGCDIFGGGISAISWKPSDIDLRWDRTIVDVKSPSVTLDAPVTMALDKKWAETVIMNYSWPGRISEVGIENLTLVSDYNTRYPKDEDHCWDGITIANAENCWVRKVDFHHFAGSAVLLQPTTSKVTVEDCAATEPVSEIGGGRRIVFQTLGQQNLFQRCYSKNGINDFAAGFIAPGPNAFVQCDAEESLGFSGAIDAWAPGLLFDIVNIYGNNLILKNLGQDTNGAGGNTGNSTF